MIPYHIPTSVEGEAEALKNALESGVLNGSGPSVGRCARWLSDHIPCAGAFLTSSGSMALNMAAFLCGAGPGDEVILPSFTFASTANAFAARGARLKFVDVRPDTMNIDEKKIEAAVTPRTRAICAVHYAGVACEMDAIMTIAKRHGLLVVEDAAQALMASYKGRPLGSIGDFGCFSFHDTKNYTMGEGGALLVRDGKYLPAAERYYEKGTDRLSFARGEVEYYTWQGLGDSCVPCELGAACLYPQLLRAGEINRAMRAAWDRYARGLEPLRRDGKLGLPGVPEGCVHNAHIFYLLCRSEGERQRLKAHLAQAGITAVSHYVPLHSAPAGLRFGEFVGEDEHTTRLSKRLLRLPLYYGIGTRDQDEVLRAVFRFYEDDGGAEEESGTGIIG